MFKAIGNFLNQSPWWALILGGLGVVVALGVFTVPFNVINLEKRGESPEQRRAIQREVHTTLGQSALSVAEQVVGSMQRSTSDPAKREELAETLKEISQARVDMESAVGEARLVERIARDGARKANRDANDAIAEARQNATKALKRSGFSDAEIQTTLDEAFKTATVTKNIKPDVTGKPANGGKQADGARDINIGNARDDKAGAFGFKLDLDAKDKNPATSPVASTDSVPPLASLPTLPIPLRDDIRSRVQGDVFRMGVGSIAIVLFIPFFLVALIAKFFIDRARAAQQLAELKKNEAEYHNINRQITEAKLQALQAQVEPHFLYNTLANVQALIEVDAAAANKMIGHLIQYLRAALPKMRENTSTVGQEVELVRAYLNILKMRMDARLEFDIQVPSEIEVLPFPPLMLPSLVENAIKHGLEPQRDGGRIDIVASLDGEKIKLTVRDTGRGLSNSGDTVGGGLGLSNIRERLQALYGDEAKFTLEENLPHGVAASIVVPRNPNPARASTMSNNQNADAANAATAAMQTKKQQVWSAVSKTHSVWTKVLSSGFMGALIVMAVVFGVALAAMLAGFLPDDFGVSIGGMKISGMEGRALGSLGVLAAFGAAALALALVVLIIYGLGILFAGLLLFIPLMILIGIFPALAPFILIGLAIYWFIQRGKRKADAQQSGDTK